MTKLTLIINSNEIHRNEQIKEVYTSWGYTYTNSREVTEWKQGLSGNGLFQQTFTILDLTSDSDLANFKSLVEKDKKRVIFTSNWYGNGVILVVKTMRGQWLHKFINEFKGNIIEKVDTEQAKQDFLDRLNLSADCRHFVSSYVGTNYEDLIRIENALKHITNEERKRIDIETLYTYLPNKKGVIPPWECVKSITVGDPKAFEEFDRVALNIHPLIIHATLKTKFSLIAKYKGLVASGMSKQHILKALNIDKEWKLNEAKQNRNSLEVIQSIIHALYQHENDYKGGDATTDIQTATTILIGKIIVAIRTNKPIKGGN